MFLDYRRSVARLDDSAVVMLAGSDARTHRTSMNSNVVGESPEAIRVSLLGYPLRIAAGAQMISRLGLIFRHARRRGKAEQCSIGMG